MSVNDFTDSDIVDYNYPGGKREQPETPLVQAEPTTLFDGSKLPDYYIDGQIAHPSNIFEDTAETTQQPYRKATLIDRALGWLGFGLENPQLIQEAELPAPLPPPNGADRIG